MNRLFWIAAILFTLASCTEQIDTSSRYVFTDKTITQYLEGKDYYSEYMRLLGKTRVSPYSETTLKQLLSARGHYTVFAPTNDAIQAYLDSLFAGGIIKEPSWEGFTEQSVLDSISIEGVAAINKNNRGIVLTNGFVHQMEGVIAPSDKRLGDMVREWIHQPNSGYSVMARLIMACGLEDTLNAYRDETWEELYLTGGVKNLPNHTSVGQAGTIPQHRYFGFTLFAETDRFWEETLGQKVEDISPDMVRDFLQQSGLFDYIEGTTFDDNYTSQMNVLNQFVTYHLLPQRIGRDNLVIHYNELGYNATSSKTPTIPIMDYYETMGLPRLLKTYESRESEGIYLNRFPRLRNGRGQFGPTRENINDYHESGLFPPLKGASTTPDENLGIRVLTTSEAGTDATNIANAVVHPIGGLLVCTENVCNQMGSQRIRFDACCTMPEMMNNNIRQTRAYYPDGAANVRAIPTNYPYLESVEIREGTQFYYLQGYLSGYHNLQGDEFNIIGQYDFTMKLPPVPRAGQYEIRFGVATGSYVSIPVRLLFRSNSIIL